MGFREYNPGLNRFLTRDMFNDALQDIALGTDPWNANLYMFGGGNPIGRIELDGRMNSIEDGGGNGGMTPRPTPPPTTPPQVPNNVGQQINESLGLPPSATQQQQAIRMAQMGVNPAIVGFNVGAAEANKTGLPEAMELIAELTGIKDAQDCAYELKPVACGMTAIGVVPVGRVAKAAKVAFAIRHADEAARAGEDVAETMAKMCSFGAATVVLMADGSKKLIKDISVGDKILATDPETGEQAAKTVEHVWIHNDTVLDLVVDGEVITTTEDHPFWSVTDRRFERADELAAGEKVLGADGREITVSGLKVGTAHDARAYNLTVDGIHTYHVGQAEILVHNDCGLLLSYKQGARMTTPQATELANWLGYTRVKGATSHGQAVYTNGKNFISPDVDSHSRGVWKMASSLNGFGANQRLGTYDFLLQRFAK